MSRSYHRGFSWYCAEAGKALGAKPGSSTDGGGRGKSRISAKDGGSGLGPASCGGLTGMAGSCCLS